jgi:hypothetical protein
MREYDPHILIPATMLFIWFATMGFLIKVYLESKADGK